MIQPGKFTLGNGIVECEYAPKNVHVPIGSYYDETTVEGPIWRVDNCEDMSYAVPHDVFIENYNPIDVFAFAQLQEAGVELSDEKQRLVECVTE